VIRKQNLKDINLNIQSHPAEADNSTIQAIPSEKWWKAYKMEGKCKVLPVLN
jgi:hypothetical protein